MKLHLIKLLTRSLRLMLRNEILDMWLNFYKEQTKTTSFRNIQAVYFFGYNVLNSATAW